MSLGWNKTSGSVELGKSLHSNHQIISSPVSENVQIFKSS